MIAGYLPRIVAVSAKRDRDGESMGTSVGRVLEFRAAST